MFGNTALGALKKVGGEAYWEFLAKKKLTRLQNNMLNVSFGVTRLIPDDKTLKMLDKFDDTKLIEHLNSFLIKTTHNSLDEFGKTELVGGKKTISTSKNSDGTLGVVGSDAKIYDLPDSGNDDRLYLKLYGISGIIPPEATADYDRFEFKEGGALSVDTKYNKKYKRTTRHKTLVEIYKTLDTSNMYFIGVKAGHLMAAGTAFVYANSPDVYYPSPVVMLCMMVAQGVVHDAVRMMYSIATTGHSLIADPWKAISNNFMNPDYKLFQNPDRAKKIFALKREIKEKDTYTYDELMEILKKHYGDIKGLDKKLKFDYLYYLFVDKLTLSIHRTDAATANNLLTSIMREAHRLFDAKHQEDFKQTTFEKMFVLRPLFMYCSYKYLCL